MTTKRTSKSSSSTPISHTRHQDKRANIPTRELGGFVADDEQTPKTLLYPRDPSLDPQLVWQGKDEQDAAALEVPAVPVYIQEKISPQAIIENLRAARRESAPADGFQMQLFADFNNISFEDLVDFYHHEQNWTNRLILGDSLLVMTSLAEKEGLKGKVQMIYLDPPYGIKFGSNWQVSTRKRDVKDGKEEDLTRQPEQIKAFRDTWELGIHSYLAYLRDRLVLARELLTESGSIFVQIGDENVHLVRCLLDEVFGSENFCGLISYQKTGGLLTKLLPSRADFILWYAKNIGVVKYRQIYLEKSFEEGTADTYSWARFPDGSYRGIKFEERLKPELLEDGNIYKPDNLTSQGNPILNFSFRGKIFTGGWKTTISGMENLAKTDRIHLAKNSIMYIRYLSDFSVVPLTQTWIDTSTGSFTDEKIYVVQSASKAIERCLLMTTDPGDLVLDPTCGSGTTAYVAEQWGRRWITIDTSRVAVALARTRLMAGRFPYYLLADSPEGTRREAELNGTFPSPFKGEGQGEGSNMPVQGAVGGRSGGSDIKKGFVYKRVPHITLKSIANNEEIDTIHARWEEKLAPLLAQINAAAGQHWQEWEVPKSDGDLSLALARDWSRELEQLLVDYWRLWQEEEDEITALRTRKGYIDEVYELPARMDEITTRYKEKRAQVLAQINQAAGKDWKEGEVPKSGSPFSMHLSTSGERKLKEQLAEYLKLRRERQKEMDASIARRADVELLYDQPYEDNKRVRVSGPFTVESLSPHRVLSTEVERPASEESAERQPGSGQFETLILENLRTAGVQNTRKGERLNFTRLEPYAGLWLHAVGEYEETGKAKRAALCIGPERGTVGPELIKEAAKEAMQGLGFDLLVVLGFAFDPHVSEDIKHYGRLTVLPVRINPDLQMGAGVLKKTGSGNLFMVFGEPDVLVEKQADGRITVTVRGVDIYDPTTGEVRSSSTDEIACWFIDTDYNGESFFVRHAYFTGADEPYDKLKRALRAEIDEAAWSALYATTSFPFEKPSTGKIAVKVINHYGDEVLKVFPV